MGFVEKYLPLIAMLGIQVPYAIMALVARAALLKGMSPRVFSVYRHAIATLFLAPIAYFSRSKSKRLSLDLKSFFLIFLLGFIGITINQNLYFEGVFLATSSMATAMGNLVPAVTFVIAIVLRLERVQMRNLRSIAKIGGTVACLSGAMCMALLRGPKLLNNTTHSEVKSTLFGLASGNDQAWLLGCLCLFGSCFCWSIWLILQVPASTSYPDNLALTAWMCFFATIQSFIVTLFLEPINIQTWTPHSRIEVFCYFFSGMVGSGFNFFVQSWCVSKRGPVFTGMFNPLCTIITTIMAALFLHEEIYTGSLLGGVAVIIGLYIVLWGKAHDYVKEESTKEHSIESSSVDTSSHKIDLEEPLLSKEDV